MAQNNRNEEATSNSLTSTKRLKIRLIRQVQKTDAGKAQAQLSDAVKAGADKAKKVSQQQTAQKLQKRKDNATSRIQQYII